MSTCPRTSFYEDALKCRTLATYWAACYPAWHESCLGQINSSIPNNSNKLLLDQNIYFWCTLLPLKNWNSQTGTKLIKRKDSLQSERYTIVRRLINQLPTLNKYGPSSTGVGKDQNIVVKKDSTKVGKNKRRVYGTRMPIHSNRRDWLLSSKMPWRKTSMCDWCLRTVFFYQENYHKLLKTAHPQRLAFRKQCPKSINIEYSQGFACNTHTDRQTNWLL